MVLFKQKLLLILLITLFFGCATTNTKPESKTIEETIPITVANIRGHKSLYNEGWFVVTSSKETLEFAKKHGFDNAKNALFSAMESISIDSSDYSQSILKDIKKGHDTTVSIYKEGTKRSKNISQTTKELSTQQLDYSKETFFNAWDTFIKGNITLALRTKEDRNKLKNIPGNYFKDLKSDFSNLGDISSSITFAESKNIALHWENAFRDAKKSFIESYDESGESESSLGGLFNIMYGYLKVIYHGALKPTAKTVKSGAENTYLVGENTAKLIYLPIGATISVVNRSVESIGLTLYYTSSIGVKIVSPTVEAGFLSALSLLSLNTSALTYVGGESVGLVNQIGTTAVAPVAGVVHTVSNTAYDTTKLVTYVSYDVIKGTTKIFINEAASGVVLGYNALLAIPTHTLMAASDGVFFLAWDGPRLVVAVAKGEVSNENINKLPVGTIIDLKKLKKEKGVSVEVISTDYSVIEDILHQLPKDMRR